VVSVDVEVMESLVVGMLLIANFAMKQGRPQGSMKMSSDSIFEVVNLHLFAGVVPSPASPNILLVLVKVESLLA